MFLPRRFKAFLLQLCLSVYAAAEESLYVSAEGS